MWIHVLLLTSTISIYNMNHPPLPWGFTFENRTRRPKMDPPLGAPCEGSCRNPGRTSSHYPQRQGQRSSPMIVTPSHDSWLALINAYKCASSDDNCHQVLAIRCSESTSTIASSGKPGCHWSGVHLPPTLNYLDVFIWVMTNHPQKNA